MKKLLYVLSLAVISTLITANALALSLTPGLNILTGTQAPFDFEGDVSGVVFSHVTNETSNGVVTYAKGTDTDNKAAALEKAGRYFYFEGFPVIEKERPVNYSFDYVYGGQIRVTLNGDTTGKQALLHKYIKNGATDEWASTPFTSMARKSVDGLTDTSDLQYVGGEDITQLHFHNYSGKAEKPVYIDNISIVPAYKLTLDLCGGISTADTDIFTFDGSFSNLPDSTQVARAGYVFAGWGASRDATEAVSSVTFTKGEDMTLYALWREDTESLTKLVELYDGEAVRSFHNVTTGKGLTVPKDEISDDGKILLGWRTADCSEIFGSKIPAVKDDMKLYSLWSDNETKPGINVFGDGTFESGTVHARPSLGRASIVADNDGNKILQYERLTGYASITHPVSWESGRPYKIAFRFKADYSTNIVINAVFNEEITAEDGTVTTKTNHFVKQKKLTADEWYSYSAKYTFPLSDYTGTDNDAISIYYNPNSDGNGGVVYYDDIEFIPYYKVTYVAEGAVSGVPKTEYFLSDKYTVLENEPLRAGFTFLGWSLKPDSVTKVTEVVPTKGEDITLYAIWESNVQKEAICYTYKSDIAGVANGTISVKCPEEVASYTNIEVYFADNDGLLTEFTPFATMEITEGNAVYSVTGNRGFAEGVTRLAFVFKAEGLEDITYWYTIPEQHRLDVSQSTKKFTFFATSDSHLSSVGYSSDYWPQMTVNRNNAMADIFASDADFMFINGDVVNYGMEEFATALTRYLDERLNNEGYNKNKIPVFLTNGNHEYMNNFPDAESTNGGFDFDPIQGVILGQLDYIAQNYPHIKITHDGQSMWYAADIYGSRFIFLSSPEEKAEGDKHTYVMSDVQLDFLENQLCDSENEGKTVFVVTHVPLDGYVPAYSDTGYQTGISNTSAIEEILAKHPNTLFLTGHSHSDIGDEDSHFVVAGDMETKFTHLNDGCLVWIDPTDGVGENAQNKIVSYSTGMYIRVYDDKIVIMGRKFLSDSKYFGHAVYIIPTPKEASEEQITPTPVTMGSTAADVLTADITLSGEYEGGVLIVGAYDQNGKLTSIAIKDEYTSVLNITVDASLGAHSVKAFVFDSTSSLKPKCVVVQKELS